MQLCLPQPTDHRAPPRAAADDGDEEGGGGGGVDPLRTAFDKGAGLPAQHGGGGGAGAAPAEKAHPLPSLLAPNPAGDGVLLTLPMSERVARAKRPRLLAMHFRTTVEVMKHGGDAGGVEQVALAP